MKIRLSAVVAALAAAHPLAVPLYAADEPMAEPVVVTATRQEQRANEVMASVDVIDRETIERSGQTTLPELLNAQTGLRVTTNGGPGSNAGVFIRGAESRHTLVLVDGMRIGSATSGQAALEVIPLALVERIEILRGPASALYGSEAIGGVIQIFTRKGEAGFHPEVFAGYGSDDTREANASLSGGAGRLRYNVTAGEYATDAFNAKPDPSKVFGANPDKDGFRNSYASASASLGFRERDEAGVNLYHSDGRNWYDTNLTFNSYLDKRLDSLSVYSKNALSDAWTSTVRLGRSEDVLDNYDTATSHSRFETTQTQFVWQHDVRLPLGSLLAAYEYLDQQVGGTVDYVKDSRRVHALLLGWTARIGDHHLQANVRHDDNSQFGGKTTGLVAYGYQIAPQWRVHGSIGTAFNAPTFNQLYFPDTGFGGGNPDLKPEEALNREIGVRWDNGVHAVDATYFNNKVRDLIAGWPPQNINDAKLEGVELGYRGTILGYSVQAGIDYLDAKDENTGKRLPRRAEEAGFLRVDRAVGAWNLGVEWNGAGRRYENVSNSLDMAGYGLLNAYAHYAFAPGWRAELRANNILDREYELSRGYATAGASVFAGVRYAPR